MYNRHLLMCRPDYFRIAFQINPYMDTHVQPDPTILHHEYDALIAAHQTAGRTLDFIEPDPSLPDMTFTANHALIRGQKAVLAQLPPERHPEVAHTRRWLKAHGFDVVESPHLFSGQGDALPTGTGAVIKGRGWRSDPRTDALVHEHLGYEVIPVHTTGPEWYDIDLVIAILRPGLIAVYLDALDAPSLATLRARIDLEIIPVPLADARRFALNLVSDGTTVTLPAGSPGFERMLESRGFTVVPLPITQLQLSGGGVRCTALALDTN
jgi:N-dimethylarginine dimethylaminohydrolase